MYIHFKLFVRYGTAASYLCTWSSNLRERRDQRDMSALSDEPSVAILHSILKVHITELRVNSSGFVYVPPRPREIHVVHPNLSNLSTQISTLSSTVHYTMTYL